MAVTNTPAYYDEATITAPIFFNTNSFSALDGQWGSWSNVSCCTLTCGGGLRVRSRQCNNPVPSLGGKYCLGQSEMVEECNTDSCKITTILDKMLQNFLHL
jgi:hypothetical protein